MFFKVLYKEIQCLCKHFAWLFLVLCSENGKPFLSTENVLPHQTQITPFRACCRWQECCVDKRQKRAPSCSSRGGPVRVAVAVTATVAAMRGTAASPVRPPGAQRGRTGVWEMCTRTGRARFPLPFTPLRDTPLTPIPSATRPLKVSMWN